ncbi:MAG: hypothetical protein KKG09_06850 [Verrucomicrobia bacterium]|nr:hypothetical protein [Verrucomicrobiota bacterium]MBU4247206.1 hypothetical protein [Verrucomicrobiota bacterium]MBU4291377.1 hypothetical protein [Verrucomicrobiota bacterium]MBU4497701.1 hypothetical protein [Verrucomicrobiota bacterium]MCG2680659.1 hypothetical protein [Kiritimatiellia bacterium]
MTNKPDKKIDASRRRTRRWKPNPHHISGIHNYCDRWCERCAYTARCAVYADERASDDGDPASRDITNERFWKRLGNIFAETMEMVREMAAEKGIDLDHIPPEEQLEIEAAEQKREETVEQHLLTRASRDYGLQVYQWLKASAPMFREKGKTLIMAARLELPGHTPENDAAETLEAIEVVSWYHLQIGVKLARAIGGRSEEVPEIIEDLPKDWDGSAKIALIGMERSMAAWGILLRHFPEREDEILSFLAALKGLQRQTEREFPNARAFIRPGFDGGPAKA